MKTYNRDYLMSLLRYDPQTGYVHWINATKGGSRRIPADTVAGTLNDGYVKINHKSTVYRAHILAWLFMTGSLPPKGKEIDHINRVKHDNRWSNLRLVNRSRNNHNAPPSIRNKSGTRGVSWSAHRQHWLARIQIDGKLIHLGVFLTKEDAVAARNAAEKTMLPKQRVRPIV